MERWAIAIFAILGAFFACGIGGAIIAGLADVWVEPVAGFSAAFSVVAITYIAVPNSKSVATVIVFLLGSALAWFLLEPSHYPSTYLDKAYQQTHLPLIITVGGGLISLLISLWPYHRGSSSAA